MSSRHLVRRVTIAVVLGCATACAGSMSPPQIAPSSQSDWTKSLDRAFAFASAGQFPQGDSVLVDFAASHPSAPQTVEVKYWRALFNLRGAVGPASTAIVLPLLQSYVAVGPSTEHWMEAQALLRTTARLDTLTRTTTTYVARGDVDSGTSAAGRADAKAQDDEIKRLKDELAKSKDELDRIKKRLAEPPKKPPTT